MILIPIRLLPSEIVHKKLGYDKVSYIKMTRRVSCHLSCSMEVVCSVTMWSVTPLCLQFSHCHGYFPKSWGDNTVQGEPLFVDLERLKTPFKPQGLIC